MTAILSNLGCVKDYTPPSPIYSQLIDWKKNAMPQVFNANSFWKTCFINNFHEIPSKHSFHMRHNDFLVHTSTKDWVMKIMSTQLMPPAMGIILCYVAITNLKFYSLTVSW